MKLSRVVRDGIERAGWGVPPGGYLGPLDADIYLVVGRRLAPVPVQSERDPSGPVLLIGDESQFDSIRHRLHGGPVVAVPESSSLAAVTAAVVEFLTQIASRPSGARSRGVIEALHRTVTFLVTENDDLLALVDDYAGQVEETSGELTEAQIEIRSLKAALVQVRELNDALLRELSKSHVDDQTSSLIVRAMKKGVDYVMLGAITFGATYYGTVAAAHGETLQKVEAARFEVQCECDEAIAAIGGPYLGIGELVDEEGGC